MTSTLYCPAWRSASTLLNSERVLQAEILALDLRKVLAERLDDAGAGRLAVMGVVQELAFLLRLGDVGRGLETVHRGDLAILRRGMAGRLPGSAAGPQRQGRL